MTAEIGAALVVAALAALLHTAVVVAQTTHVVGGDLGWLVPPGGPIAYATWAYTQTFVAGDIIVFSFTTGEQDVAMVSKEAYDSCNSTNPISLKTTGPANFTVDVARDYYFIATLEWHCPLGQKLAVKVIDSSAGPGPSAPPTTPAPSRAPMTFTVGDGLGWLVPPLGKVAYDTWAYNKVFIVGDTLVFNFVNGTQNVAVVTKEAFEVCNTSTTVGLYRDSPAIITLITVGIHYFTSTYDRHCALGQMLAIDVIASSGTSPPASRSPVNYTVGDKLGWLVPPFGEVAYATWAYGKFFIVSDTLVFDFVNGTQDVAVVTKEAYDSCNTSSAIAVYTVSPAAITLTTSGMHYFTSTYAHHCILGQKLAANVVARSTASPPPGHIAASPSTGGPTASPQSSSAPPRVVAGAVALFSMAIAFLH